VALRKGLKEQCQGRGRTQLGLVVQRNVYKPPRSFSGSAVTLVTKGKKEQKKTGNGANSGTMKQQAGGWGAVRTIGRGRTAKMWLDMLGRQKGKRGGGGLNEAGERLIGDKPKHAVIAGKKPRCSLNCLSPDKSSFFTLVYLLFSQSWKKEKGQEESPGLLRANIDGPRPTSLNKHSLTSRCFNVKMDP